MISFWFTRLKDWWEHVAMRKVDAPRRLVLISQGTLIRLHTALSDAQTRAESAEEKLAEHLLLDALLRANHQADAMAYFESDSSIEQDTETGY